MIEIHVLFPAQIKKTLYADFGYKKMIRLITCYSAKGSSYRWVVIAVRGKIES